MSYMDYRNPWIQCDSMGIIHSHGIIAPVAWAKFHHCNVPSHGYSSCLWIYIKNQVIASTTKSLFCYHCCYHCYYYFFPPFLPPLLPLLPPILSPLPAKSLPLLAAHRPAVLRRCRLASLASLSPLLLRILRLRWVLVAIDEIFGQSGVLSWFVPPWQATEHFVFALKYAYRRIEHYVFWSRQLYWIGTFSEVLSWAA